MIITGAKYKPKTKRAKKRERLDNSSVFTFHGMFAEMSLRLEKSEVMTYTVRMQIIKRYIELMVGAILRGVQWNLPDDAGTFAILKADYHVDRGVKVAKGMQHAYAFDVMGNAYRAEYLSPDMISLGYKFMQHPKLQERLQEFLDAGDIPHYRTQFA